MCEPAWSCFAKINGFAIETEIPDDFQFSLINVLSENGKLSFSEMLEWDFARLLKFAEWINTKIEEAENRANQKVAQENANGSSTI